MRVARTGREGKGLRERARGNSQEGKWDWVGFGGRGWMVVYEGCGF